MKFPRLILCCFICTFAFSLPNAYSQTSVTAATAVSLCVDGSAQTLSNITVAETATNGFGTQAGTNFILTAPTDFIFVSPGAVTVTPSSHITVNSVTVATSTITINLTVSATVAIDDFVISNLQVQAVSTNASGDILRLGTIGTGGNFNVSGGDASRGNGWSYGPLSSVLPPSTSNAGATQSVCALVATLAGNNPAVGTGTWSKISGPGTITFGNVNVNNTTATASVQGTYVLQWSIANGSCTTSTSTVTINYYANPSVSAPGSNQTLCGNSTTLAATPPGVGTGLWTVVAGAGGSFVNPALATTVFNGVQGTTYTLAWTVSNGSCVPSSNNVTIQFDQVATPSNAGSTQNICGLLATLAGNDPTLGTGGTGTWTKNSGPGTITFGNIHTFNTTATASVVGTYVLQWSIVNGATCPTSSSTVTINYYANPSVSAPGSNQTLCGNSTTLAATPPGVGTGLWTVVAGAGGGFVNPALATTVFNGVQGTTYTLAWTVSNGSCVPSSNNVTIQFDQVATPSNAGSTQNICGLLATLAGNDPTLGTGGTGTWTKNSGPGTITFGNIHTFNTTATASVVGTYVLQWSIVNGATCPTSSSTVTINYYANPSVSAPGSNQTLCGNSTTLAATPPGVGTGLWTVVAGAGGSFVNPALATTVFNGVQGTTYTLAWTVSNGSCVPSSNNVTIQFDQVATPSNAGSTQNICGLLATLAGNDPTLGTGGTGTWTKNSGPGTITFGNIHTFNTTATASVVGTYVLQWSIVNGATCPTSSSTVTINYYANPSVSAPGSNQTLCGNSTTLAATPPGVGTGLWTVVAGAGGGFVNPALATTVFNGVQGTTYTLAWTVSNGSCVPSSNNVTIQFDQVATPSNAGSTQNICGLLATLAGNDPTLGTGGTGTWTKNSGPGTITFGNIHTFNTTATASVVGTYVLQWSIVNGATCPTSSSTVTINYYANPSVSAPGSNQTLCGNSTTLAATPPGVGTGLWTVVAGAGGSFVNPALATTVFNGVQGTTYTLAWTVSNGSCVPSSNNVTIQFDQVATPANAGSTQNICGLLATLAGNDPTLGTGGTGTWTKNSGPGTITFGNIHTFNTTATASVVGTYVLQWSIVNGATCPTSSSTVTINYYANPSVSAPGSNQTLCGNSTTLAATPPGVGTGLWTVVAGAGGGFVNPALATTVFNGVQGTTYTLAWTVSNGSCVPSSNNVTIQFDQVATPANAGSTQNICGLLATLAGNDPTLGTGGTGTWTKNSGPGTITFGNIHTFNTTATASVVGTYVLQWSIVNGATCPTSSSTVTINYYANPSVSAPGSNQTLCGNSTTLAATPPGVGTGLWTVVAGAGGGFVNPALATTVFNGVQGTTYTLAWTVSNGSCVPSSNNVTIQFDQVATPSNAGSTQNICGLLATLAGNDPTLGTGGTGTWTKNSGPGTITFGNIHTFNTTATASVVGTYVLQWSIVNGATCPTSSSTVTINYYANPSVSAPGSNQTLCGNSTTLAATPPGVGTGLWTVVAGAGGSFVNPALATTVFNGVQGTTYTLAWTVSNGSCVPSSNNVTIQFDQLPTVANAGSDMDQCGNSTFNITGNTPTVGTGLWANIGGYGGVTITTPGSPSTSVTGLPAGQSVTLSWTITNGTCGSTTDDVVLLNRASANPADAGPDQGQCNNSIFTLAGNDPSPGTGLWTVTAGSASITAPNSYNSTVTGILAGTSATLQWTITNGSCLSTNDIVVLTNTSPALSANAGLDIDQCNNGSFSLTGSNPSPGTGTWTDVGGYVGVTIGSPNSASTSVTGLPVGNNVTLRWTVVNGSCATTTDDILLTNSQAPIVPVNAGPAQDQCSNSIFTLAGSDPTPGTGLWTVTAGTATITNPSLANTTVTGIAAGTGATLLWTVSSGSCPPSSSSVLLSNDDPPAAAYAGLDQDQCITSTFTVSGSSPSPGTGMWTVVSGNPSIPVGLVIVSPTSVSTSVTGVTAGYSVTLRWSVSNNSCAGSSDDVVLTNRSTAANSVAGGPQSQCNNGTFVLAGSDPTPGTGLWTIVSGPGSITAPTSRNSTITGVTAGSSTTLQWTVSNGSCGSTNSTVSLINNALTPVSNAGPDQSICVTSTPLAGNSPLPYTGLWTIISGVGGSFVSASTYNTTFSGTAGVTYTLRWTITNGVCVSTDDVVIAMKLVPNVAASGETICSGQFTNIPITNPNAVPGTVFNWAIQSSANVSGAAIGTGSVISQQLTSSDGFNPGNVVYRITPSSNGCNGNFLDVTVNVNAVPSVAAVPLSSSICGGQTTSIAISNPNGVTGGATFNWTANILSGTVTGSSGGSGSSIAQLLTTNNVGGMVRYSIQATANTGGCLSPVVNADVNVNPVPTASVNGASTTALCSGSTTNIQLQNPNSVAGTTFTWTSTVLSGTAAGNTSGSGSTILDVLTTPTTGGVVQYSIIPAANGCPGTAITWNVTISSTPVANAGPDIDQCITSSFTLAGNPPAPGTGLWTIQSGPGSIVTATAFNSTVNGVTAGNSTVLRWTVSNGSCPNVFDDVVLTNRLQALNANAGVAQTQCNNSTFLLAGSDPTPGTGLWTVTSGAATITNPTSYSSTVTGIAAGTSATLQWTVTNGSCGTTNSTVVLTNNAPPPIANAGPDQSVCLTSALLAGNPQGIGTGAWTIISGAGGSFVSASTNNTTFNGTAGVTYTLRWTITNGVCTSSDDVIIVMKLVPDVAASGQTICSNQFTNIAITNPNATPGTTFNWTILSSPNVTGSAPGSGSLISQQLTSTDGVNPGNVVYQITPTSGGCNGNFLNVTVNVNAVPTVSAVPLSGPICGGQPTNIALTNANNITGGVVFNWTASVLSGVIAGQSSGNGTTIAQTLTTDNVGGSVRYTIQATANTGGCVGPAVTADVAVNPVPTAAINGASTAAVCSGGTTNVLMQNPNNVAGTTFTWTSSLLSGSASGNSSGTGSIVEDVLTTAAVAGGKIRYFITPVATGCNGTAVTWDVTVNPVPTATNFTEAASCSSVPFSYDPQLYITNSLMSTFTWSASYSGLTGGNGNGSGPVAESLINLTASPITAVYTVTPTFGGCSGATFTISVPVNPQPTGTAQNLTRCSNSPVAVNLGTVGGSVAAASFTISVNPNGLTQTGGIPSAGTGKTLTELQDDIWQNINGLAVSVVYTITPFTGAGSTGCAGNPFTVRVIVNPEPVGVAYSKNTCSDVAANYDLADNIGTLGNNVGSTFTWLTSANPYGGSTTPQTGSVITDVLNNVTGGDQPVAYTVTPTGVDGCMGQNFTIIINVHPEPVEATAVAPTICSGSNVNYALQPNVNFGIPSSFTWIAAVNSNVGGESTITQTINSISDILTNTTPGPQTVVYTVVPTGTTYGCVGDPFMISVAVNPQAVVSAGPDEKVCANATSAMLAGVITFAPNGAQWTTNGTGSFLLGTTATPTYNLGPGELNTTTPITLTMTLTGADPDGMLPSEPCTAQLDQMNLIINPLPNVGFSGLPTNGMPPHEAENIPPNTLKGFNSGGMFTIVPGSGLGSTTIVGGFDQVMFDPHAATVDSLNTITYTYTDPNGCTNSNSQDVFIDEVTTIDFTINRSTTNFSTGEMQICAQQDTVRLIGNPSVTTGFSVSQFTFSPAYAGQIIPPNIVFNGGQYYLQTNGLVSDTYVIDYTFTNSAGAVSNKQKNVHVFASPSAAISVAGSCIASAISFTDASTLPGGAGTLAPPTPVINNWNWDFADGQGFSNLQNPNYTYHSPNIYDVHLTVATNQGCSDTTSLHIRVGSVPIVNFAWNAICANHDSTRFVNETNPGNISKIINYTWNFGDPRYPTVLSGDSISGVPVGTDGGNTSGYYKHPNHSYDSGVYLVDLKVITNDGCNNHLTKTVKIVPYSPAQIVATGGYFENFETGKGGWQTDITNQIQVQDSISWEWGAPSGTVINSGAKGSSNAWWTKDHTRTVANNTSYYPNEQSVVNGPCFDLSLLKRPMISMDYFVDTQKGFDGTVLQYSTDGGVNWYNVGSPSVGINWYPQSPIIGDPGGAGVGNNNYFGNGWSGQSGKWINAASNLDTIQGNRTLVRFRIAFGSDATTPPGASYDGFAFDNVYIGEKQRNVLVEHFTNALAVPASHQADVWLNNLYQKEIAIYGAGVSDFRDIQYHVNLPSPDPLSNDNAVDPSARALYYGLGQPPVTIMDGLEDTAPFTGYYTDITRNSTDMRALKNPPFQLSLTAAVGSASNKINVTLGITADTIAFSSPLLAQVVLIENSVAVGATTFQNVVRKQLLGPVGEQINSSWVNNQTINESKTDVVIDVPIVNSNQLTLVGYVQNKITKEIYQSIAIPSPAVQGSAITGLQEPTTASEIQMFPNPASSFVNFGLPDNLPPGYTWRIIDQRGVEVRSGDFNGAINGQKRAEIAGLADGMYIVMIGAPEKPATYRKLIVMNQR